MTTKRIFSTFLMIALSSCATKAKTPDAPIAEAAKPHYEKASEKPADNIADKSDSMNLSTVPALAGGIEAKEDSKPQAVPAGHATKKKDKGVDAKQSMLWLEHGNKRFIKGHVRKDGQSRKDIARLVTGQNPHAIILACSDSRVPPEIVFDQKLGEIFVVRTAGESLDPNVIASIEYAVTQFGSKLIVVMGHTSCGAVNAAIQSVAGSDAGSQALNHLVADIQPRIKVSMAKGTPTADAARESWANAQGIAEDLKRLSPIIADAVEHDGVVIQPALYYINSGEVKFE